MDKRKRKLFNGASFFYAQKKSTNDENRLYSGFAQQNSSALNHLEEQTQ